MTEVYKYKCYCTYKGEQFPPAKFVFQNTCGSFVPSNVHYNNYYKKIEELMFHYLKVDSRNDEYCLITWSFRKI